MLKKARFHFFTILTPLVVAVLLIVVLNNSARTAAPSIIDVPEQSIAQIEDKAALVSGNPERLVIPNVGIDIVVKSGVFSVEDNSWTLTTDAVHYATPTILPNNLQGNTFIYGHNTNKVFGKLENLKESAEAFLHVDTGKVFAYRLVYKQTVSPYDLSLFEYQGSPMLTLQTCSGLWDEQRDLIWFEFLNVN